jgi:hypothetical protein
MWINQLEDTIESVSQRELDGLVSKIWGAVGAGTLSEQDAQRLALRARERQLAHQRARRPEGRIGRYSIFPVRRYQRTRDRNASLTRRRQHAFSGPLPPHLAAEFTAGELAVLAIITAEASANGQCVKSLAEIAARAGVCRTTAQNAIRQAKRLDLLTVQERRREGQRNDYNIILIKSREWFLWIKKGRAGGFKKFAPTVTNRKNSLFSPPRQGSDRLRKPALEDPIATPEVRGD